MPIFRLIPAGDLELSSTGDIVWSTGPDYIRQRLAARFQFFLGEYFLDTRQGIPYFRDVFVKFPNLELIRSIFRKVILTTPGVLQLDKFELDYNDSARQLTFTFSARVEGGTVTVNPGDQDFLVSFEGP